MSAPEAVVPDQLFEHLVRVAQQSPAGAGAVAQVRLGRQIVFGAIRDGAVHCFSVPHRHRITTGAFAELLLAAKVPPEALTADQRAALLDVVARDRSAGSWEPAQA